ncbi:major facilitator superfamily domain-containing protein [Pelagophyceae sp. CCMP2097]|nr:major facilitator superfamily domain-containing protein [Pelagophyceae sp. CCMP2097]
MAAARDDAPAAERDAGSVEPAAPPRSFKWYQWPILVSIDMIGPFATDAYIPNIPQMHRDFGCLLVLATLTLQINWVFNAFSNSGCGTLSDKYGRRKVLIVALLLFIGGSGICAQAEDVRVLIAGRAIMGLGQGCSILPTAIARDTIAGVQERVRAMTLLTALRPIVIIAAPSIGGSIGAVFGWRSIFILLCGWSILTFLAVVLFLPESNEAVSGSAIVDTEPREAAIKAPPSVCGTLKLLSASRLYWGSVGLIALFFVGIAAMLTLLPFVLEHFYGLSEFHCGLLLGGIPVAGMAAGAISVSISKCCASIEPFNVVRAGMAPYAASSLVAGYLGFNYRDVHSPWFPDWLPTLLPCFLMVGLQFLMEPILRALYLQGFQAVSGSAEGISGFAQVLAMAAGSAIGAAVYDDTPKYFYLAIAASTASAQIWFWVSLGLCPPKAVFLEPDDAESETYTPLDPGDA